MDLFIHNKEYNSNYVAIEDSGNKVTYKEMGDFLDVIVNQVKSRSLVFSFCNNSIGALFGYVSFLRNKNVPVLLNEEMDTEQAYHLIHIYLPKYIYIPKSLWKNYEDYNVILEAYDYLLLETNFNKEYKLYSNLALLLTTSGSTGSPKFVRQSYHNVNANANAIAQYLELDSSERPITTLPMNYTYGLSIINSHLIVGATILLTNKGLMQREFWDFFEEYGATSFGGVPYTYEMLDKLRFLNKKLPSLRTMTQAGGKLNPELHRKFAKYAMENDKRFIVMYGQTEATARMSYLPYQKSLEKYGSMGIAIPGGEFELIDGNNHTIEEPNVVGELVYTGPNVTLGYAECGEDLIKGDERKGRLVTGDMALRDEDGYYFIVGRKKRFLKIYGNRVNLDEIERMVKTFAGDCACAGIDDNLYVFITESSDKKMMEMKQFLSRKTGLNSNGFQIKYLESIPKNEAGKVLYTKLEEYYDGI